MHLFLKYFPLYLVLTLLSLSGLHAQVSRHNALNPEIVFAGDHLLYKGNKIKLSPKAFYIDGQ